jgi:hypothetical protein
MPRKRATGPAPRVFSAAAALGSRSAKFPSNPNTPIVMINEVPPAEIIGNGIPVTGSNPTTYPKKKSESAFGSHRRRPRPAGSTSASFPRSSPTDRTLR